MRLPYSRVGYALYEIICLLLVSFDDPLIFIALPVSNLHTDGVLDKFFDVDILRMKQTLKYFLWIIQRSFSLAFC